MRRIQSPFNSFNSRIRNKERLIPFICITVALIAIVISFFIFLGGAPSNEEASEAASEKGTLAPIIYSPESPKSLEYKSLGNGTCSIVSKGRYVGSELKIPERSPAGEIVAEIEAGAFSGCDTLVSVSIPSCVIRIGEQAFKNCPSLSQISVDMSNEKYSSSGGILYSRDKSRLICCPPERAGSSYQLDKRVKFISDYAFYGVQNLSRVYYEGSTADFESIKIGRGNEEFTSLPITCNYVGAK